MAKQQRQLYETTQQIAFTWNVAPPSSAEPCEFSTIPASNPGANQYYFMVYQKNFTAFIGYADVEYPTANQIRSTR